ncbi:hypothetical protein FBEOM_6799 [Fusarium beomiforme]|uniref:C3H1-type domain-containing protein n=1 Tax=Fusarium beomiforme TaxID=44412 RepID=A0A9P5AJ01_9HYPO|nr:hypothetical protein FBEOM_6799 [Fusarium beomiforme]
MRFSQNTTKWQPALSQNIADAQTDSNGAMSRNLTTNPDAVSSNSVPYSSRATMAMDTMEDGELSEGELEDIYEPTDLNPAGGHKPNSQPSNPTTVQPATQALQTSHDVEKVTCHTKQLGRDRSGSYSPYLSPREIESSGLEGGGSKAHTQRVANDPSTKPAVVMKPLHDNGHKDDSTPRSGPRHADAVMSESKKRAEEAILRLWPLNVRYHNFIEEGIDQALLDDLFKELGLDLQATVTNQEGSKAPAISQVAKVTSNVSHPESVSIIASTANTNSKGAEQVKDKSEERKDRIARLLAAKGSKITGADTGNAKSASPMSLLPGNAKPEKTKSQSEKSKLIQQKMEALIKAREANAKAVPQAQTTPEPHLHLPVSEISRPQSIARADSVNIDEQAGVYVENADSATAPPIPGLFLSSNAPSPTPHQRKRPVAADLNEKSTDMSQKRPFGQTRESRPFLIDVSDDDDDAEMEIDSPELRPSSIQRPTTPGSRTTSFRDHSILPDSKFGRTALSPKTTGTPTTSANGMYDLESMNKKIEDMKRKIAEAEARKKAKQSGNNSPLPQSESPSKEGSVDVPASSPSAVKRAVSATTEVAQKSPASTVHHSPYGAAKLPKLRDQSVVARPSLRGRVASERLPILEARRREQAEQLKHLYSEAARLEKEIQNSLAEEERLKKDAAQHELNPSELDESELENVQGDSLVVEKTVQRSSQETNPKETLTEPVGNERMRLLREKAEQDASMDESSSLGPVVNQEAMGQLLEGESRALEENRVRGSTAPNGLSEIPTRSSTTHAAADESGDTVIDGAEEAEEDVAMEEVDSSSEEGEGFDDYEPTGVGARSPDLLSPVSWRSSSCHASPDNAVLETSDADIQAMATTTPITQPISTGDGDTESESHREATIPKVSQAGEMTEKTTFVPYETPLQYFRAYRFHPQYNESVAGGLRSLTYSNKIDVTREVCPDQLMKGVCPRGSECQFQHFENMQVPGRLPVEGTLTCRAAIDDQILLELGAYGNCEAEQHDQYVEGLRELLTDFRNRKVKDFEAISNGIIEYRAKFLGDKSKILPLGSVTL